MKKYYCLLLLFLFFLVFLNLHTPINAAGKSLGILQGWLSTRFAPDMNSSVEGSANALSLLISTALGLLTIIGGGISIIMFFLGAVRWMSSSGKPENLERAKQQLIYAAVGMIIIVAAYGLTFIIGGLLDINILGFGDYLANLGPQQGTDITGLAEKYDPGTDGVGQINVLFSVMLGGITLFAGIFFVVYFLLGALQWLASGGIPEQLEKAKKQLSAAVIGIIIVIAAYTIMFIIGTVLGVNFLNLGELINTLAGSSTGQCLPQGSNCYSATSPCCSPHSCLTTPYGKYCN